jgi:LAS superfamily LD-carboxypeptidase LdcB
MAELSNVDAELAERIRGMQNEAGQRGIVLVVTTGWRSMAEQERLYDLMIAAQKQYGRKWQQHAALAAVPGTSNHGKTPALAVDLACANPSKDNIKIHGELATKWGLWRAVPSEYWHLELDPARKPLNTPVSPSEQGDDPMSDAMVYVPRRI